MEIPQRESRTDRHKIGSEGKDIAWLGSRALPRRTNGHGVTTAATTVQGGGGGVTWCILSGLVYRISSVDAVGGTDHPVTHCNFSVVLPLISLTFFERDSSINAKSAEKLGWMVGITHRTYGWKTVDTVQK